MLPVLSFAAFIWDGVYVGLTASKEMRNTMLASSLLIFFPVYFLMESYIHNHALWLALILFLTSRGILQTILFFRKIYRLQRF
jgi:MATE family multidrug resistance protein